MQNQKAALVKNVYSLGQVSLKPLTLAAVDEGYLGWINNPDINSFLESRFTVWSKESLQNYIQKIQNDGREYLFGIFYDDVYIGNIKLGPLESYHGRASIGIIIGDPSFHGRGIGAAAVELIKGIAFNELHIRKLTAGCYAENKASLSLFTKAGFFVEGTLKNHVLWNNKECDVILMGCLRSNN